MECDISREKAWELNDARVTDKYCREAFDLLCGLYEAPINTNRSTLLLRELTEIFSDKLRMFHDIWLIYRWDSPLITIQLSDELPGEKIKDALFNRQAPPPNQSTQNIPLCSSTYLSDLDKITKDVINVCGLRVYVGYDFNTDLNLSKVELIYFLAGNFIVTKFRRKWYQHSVDRFQNRIAKIR